MSASTPFYLSAEDKLDLLQYLDEFHYWHSLDDERLCKRCGRRITGRQITIIELQGTRGKLRLKCPSAGCISTPGDWPYANPVQAAKLGAGSNGTTEKISAKTLSNDRTHDGTRATRRKRVERIPFRLAIARLSLAGPLAGGFRTIHPIA